MVLRPRRSFARLSGAPLDRIESYYFQTWADYRFLWANAENLAMHFGYYDDQVRTHAHALLNTNRVLADKACITPGARVLDAGCGVGGSSLWLAHRRAAEVVGLNRVGGQLAQAKTFAAKRRCAHSPALIQGDYTASPFADGCFDAVLAVETICHTEDKAAFYREAARVLRPGGRLVVADYMRSEIAPDRDGSRMLRQWLDGWAIPDLARREQHRAYATRAGLAQVAIEDFTRRARPSLRRLYRISRVTYPLALAARLLHLRSRVQHANVVASIRQYQLLTRGLWLYGVLSAAKPERS